MHEFGENTLDQISGFAKEISGNKSPAVRRANSMPSPRGSRKRSSFFDSIAPVNKHSRLSATESHA